MMNPFDVFVLARTKLRSHRTRTGITVAIAGLLFGLIVAVIVVTQGVFTSVDKYSGIGLNDRTLLGVSYFNQTSSFEEYNHLDDPDFVREVEEAYKTDIANKKVVAKKYSVPYDPTISDPSPIGIDPITKSKVITNDGVSSSLVQTIAQKKRDELEKKFSISDYIKPYSSATLRYMQLVQPGDGALSYMKNGQENQSVSGNRFNESMAGVGSGATLTILDGSVSKPFISSDSFDPSKGEVPVIIPVATAEKLLGLSPLSKNVSPQERRERLQFVRARVSDITASFCYRNQTSRFLLGQAVAQQDELKRVGGTKDYVKPSLFYAAPSNEDCSGVVVQSDTRSPEEKKAAANQVLFEKEIGTWLGEPVQHKVTVRGVGVSGDYDTASSNLSIGSFVGGLLNSTLGYGTWSVPKDLFDQLPAASKPDEIFSKDQTGGPFAIRYAVGGYLVEFGDKAEARALLERTGAYTGSFGDVSAYQFGSGTLFVDEARSWVEKGLFWLLVIVGSIAVIILAGIIGRTVADSRRESAVFRAIGATRTDIAHIYGVYALLLSIRVVVFSMVLGIAIGLGADLILSDSATLGAQLAYAAVDTNIRFHLFSIASWYLLVIVGVIILAGLIASVVPIILGARRNPITDMREEG